jgi:hypothetical protein
MIMKKIYNLTKLIMLAVVLFGSLLPVSAQTIQLGTGTAVNGTTTSSPVNIYYRRTVSQFVYTAAELNAAGIVGPCSLQDIGWFVTQSPLYNIPGYTVKVKHVAANNVAAALGTGGWTTVKNSFTYNPTAGGWDMLGLNNAFAWNGVDNIGVELCWSQVTPNYNASGQCRLYSTPSGYRYTWTDAAGSSCGLTPGVTNTNKPQVQMVWGSCGPPCSTPNPPSANGATTSCGNGATLSASGTPPGGTYNWYSDAAGDTLVGTGASYTTNPLYSSATFYVGAFVSPNCESTLVPVTATVVPLTAPTTIASPPSICGSGSSSITASGAPANGSYTWFSDQAGNNQIGTGANYNTGNLATTTTVYVQASDDNGSGNPESLTTTFAGGNGQSGNMFNINVLSNITITDFDVNANSNTTGNFEVYYKTGSYQGAETNAAAWTLIGTANNITSNGQGNPTPLGLNLSLQLQSGAHAFYVTGTTAGVQYTNGTNNNNIYAQNNEIEFFEGIGKAYPFGATYSPRIWNGIIHYTTGSQSTCLSVLEPVTITVDQPSSAAASVSGVGSICLGTTSTLAVQGGALVGSSNWQWFSGNCTGTLVGTGASISVTPSATTSYFVSASGNGVCPATSCAVGVVNLPAQSNVLSANGSNQTCVVNANNYIHFMDPNTGDLIASVNSLGQNLGNVTITSYENGSTQDIESCSYPGDPLFTTAVMGRHWVITSEFTPSTSVDVLLPYHFNQYDATAFSAFNNPNPDDNLNSQNDIGCTQYSGLNENANFADNCNNGTFTWHNQNTTDQVNAILPAHAATDEYITISVDGFSEFWLHGSQNAQPLPVELVDFSSRCMDGDVAIEWSTASENNSMYFEVESSVDAFNWEAIAVVDAAQFSTSLIDYAILHEGAAREKNYYRLKQVDTDGAYEYYSIIYSDCGSDLDGAPIIFPNPSKNNFTIDFGGSGMKGIVQLTLVSMEGKEISNRQLNLGEGVSTFQINNLELQSGLYLIKMIDVTGKLFIIKHRFN